VLAVTGLAAAAGAAALWAGHRGVGRRPASRRAD
jgi:hypothetical protein